MKILVISENIPKSDFSSGDKRFLGILKILASKHEVTFCIPNPKPWLKPVENKSYIDYIEGMNIRFLSLAEDFFEEIIKKETFNIGFFEFFWTAEKYMNQFIKYQPNAVVVVDSVDLHFAREETQYNLGQISKHKVLQTKKRELSVYKLADITIAVSTQDSDQLLKIDKTGNISLIPNVVPTVKRAVREREPSLIFIGCYAWPPNVDGMLWFTKEVWPLIINKRSDAKLLIVGSQATDEIKSLSNIEGVEVTGYVPKTEPYLESASISIAPLRFGGGMKGKVNEAMAHGLPVVSTSIGAQGFNIENGVQMFIADLPNDFANAVLKLLDNPDLQTKVGEAGQKQNEQLCSPAVIEKNIDELIKMCLELQKAPSLNRKSWDKWRVRKNNFVQQYIWRFFD